MTRTTSRSKSFKPTRAGTARRSKTKIEYVPQPQWTKPLERRERLIKKISGIYAEENASRKGRIAAASEAKGRANIMGLVRELHQIERRLSETPFVSARGSKVLKRIIRRPVHLSLTHFETYTVAPSNIMIGVQEQWFEPSDLVYACPNDGTGHYWSAWFTNGRTGVLRYGQHVIAGNLFTGKLRIGMEARAEGVGYLGPASKVSLRADCYVHIYRPVDNASGIYVGDDYSIATADTTSGSWSYVSLNPAYCGLSWEFDDARPGDEVHTCQVIVIDASAATVQLGPNRSDCGTGQRYGFLRTPPPTLQLEYMNVAVRQGLPREPFFPHWG